MPESRLKDLQKSLLYRSDAVDYALTIARSGQVSVQYLFGDHVVDLSLREVTRGRELVAVEPQVFDLITYLLRNRDHVVSKDNLIEAVWQGRIVSESTLTSRINAARKAIGDDGENQRLIRTYPRRGLRFVGEVREVEGDAQPNDRPDEVIEPVTLAPIDDSTSRKTFEGTGKPTVAVLPFKNLSGDSEQEYFSDGVTEDIITALSKHRSILVIARTSSFAFKNRQTDVRQIGRDLGADYIVDGSVRRSGDRIRVSAELIETEGGRHVWADRYDRDFERIFELQDEIAATIAARVEPEVGTAERLRVERKKPQALDAWDLLHLGAKHFYTAQSDANIEAQRLFRRAVELDPTLAQAYAYLSYSIVLSMIYFDAPPDGARMNEAVELARMAVQLDEQDAMIRFVYGRALLAHKSYPDALAQLVTALELNPNLAVVYCGLGDSLTYEGRIGEAIPYFQKAIEISPFDPQRWAFCSYRALAHLFAREFDRAVEWANAAIQIPNCHYWPYAHRVSALGHCGGSEEIRMAVKELLERKPGFSIEYARTRLFYVKSTEQIELYTEGLRRAEIKLA
jgi:TolB-like protein